jgi:hypothetical protein
MSEVYQAAPLDPPLMGRRSGAAWKVGQVVAFGLVMGWLIIAVPLFWANDAIGYLAAGERLNAGHALYALGPGDRPVEIHPGLWEHPFLYPPLWGIVWRPLAAIPGGLGLWMSVVSVAMLGWLYVTVRDRRNLVLVGLLSAPFAVLLASGNIAGLFLVGMALVPRLSQRNAGLLVGMMGAVKVMPALLIVWLLATRRYRAAAYAIGTGAVLTLAAYLYDPALTWQYVREVVPATEPMGFGFAWWLILPVSLALVIWKRSYAAAVVAVVLGSPAVGFAGLAMVLSARSRRSRIAR